MTDPSARSCTPSNTGLPLLVTRPRQSPCRSVADLLSAPTSSFPCRSTTGAGRGASTRRANSPELGMPVFETLKRIRAYTFANRPGGIRTTRKHARRLALRRGRRRWASHRPRRRREHDGSNAGGVCGSTPRRWGVGRQRGDGSPSRVSTSRMTSPATSDLPRSPSRLPSPQLPPAADNSRERGPEVRGRARSGRGRRPCDQPPFLERYRAGW